MLKNNTDTRSEGGGSWTAASNSGSDDDSEDIPPPYDPAWDLFSQPEHDQISRFLCLDPVEALKSEHIKRLKNKLIGIFETKPASTHNNQYFVYMILKTYEQIKKAIYHAHRLGQKKTYNKFRTQLLRLEKIMNNISSVHDSEGKTILHHVSEGKRIGKIYSLFAHPKTNLNVPLPPLPETNTTAEPTTTSTPNPTSLYPDVNVVDPHSYENDGRTSAKLDESSDEEVDPDHLHAVKMEPAVPLNEEERLRLLLQAQTAQANISDNQIRIMDKMSKSSLFQIEQAEDINARLQKSFDIMEQRKAETEKTLAAVRTYLTNQARQEVREAISQGVVKKNIDVDKTVSQMVTKKKILALLSLSKEGEKMMSLS